jgi:hypothetical protein
MVCYAPLGHKPCLRFSSNRFSVITPGKNTRVHHGVPKVVSTDRLLRYPRIPTMGDAGRHCVECSEDAKFILWNTRGTARHAVQQDT